MTILVTGGAGYIGSHTCVELLNEGYDVVVVDNLYNSNKKAIDRVEEITGKKVRFYDGDITNKADMDKVLDENKIDCVIHFAGFKAVGESVAIPVEYYRNNIDTTLTLLECMRELGISPTEEELKDMAHKCSVSVGGASGSARVLNEEDMLAIYRASM